MATVVRPLAFIALAGLAGCGLGRPDYPTFGAAEYRIEGTATQPDGSGALSSVIYRNGPKMRVETTLPGRGAATIVFDDSTGAAYILTTAPAQAAAVTATPPATTQPGAPVAQTPPPAGTQTTTTTTGQTPPGAPQAAPQTPPVIPAVAGVAIRLPDGDAPEPIEKAWASLTSETARHVGECQVAGTAGHAWRPREAQEGEPRTACITENGIVLEVTQAGVPLWRATRLEQGAQDPALFGVPAGFQIIDPQAVTETVTETLDELGSVEGDAVAPATAPPVTTTTTTTPPR